MSQINVVPYIDVMLVLLVIFMVTAPLITTTVIDLPPSAAARTPATPLEIIIKDKGIIFLRDRERSPNDRKISLDELVKHCAHGRRRNPTRRWSSRPARIWLTATWSRSWTCWSAPDQEGGPAGQPNP